MSENFDSNLGKDEMVLIYQKKEYDKSQNTLKKILTSGREGFIDLYLISDKWLNTWKEYINKKTGFNPCPLNNQDIIDFDLNSEKNSINFNIETFNVESYFHLVTKECFERFCNFQQNNHELKYKFKYLNNQIIARSNKNVILLLMLNNKFKLFILVLGDFNCEIAYDSIEKTNLNEIFLLNNCFNKKKGDIYIENYKIDFINKSLEENKNSMQQSKTDYNLKGRPLETNEVIKLLQPNQNINNFNKYLYQTDQNNNNMNLNNQQIFQNNNNNFNQNFTQNFQNNNMNLNNRLIFQNNNYNTNQNFLNNFNMNSQQNNQNNNGNQQFYRTMQNNINIQNKIFDNNINNNMNNININNGMSINYNNNIDNNINNNTNNKFINMNSNTTNNIFNNNALNSFDMNINRNDLNRTVPPPNSNNYLISNKPYNPVGLIDVGYSPFMNATLQCLSHCNELTEYLLNKYNEYNEYLNNIYKYPTTYTYSKILKNLFPQQGGYKKYYEPSGEKLKDLSNKSEGSKDLYKYILEGIHDELLIVPEINNKKNQNNNSGLTIISQNFYGARKLYEAKCQYCENKIMKQELFKYISFPLEDARKLILEGQNDNINIPPKLDSYVKLLQKNIDKKIKLKDCFDCYKTKYKDDIECNKCKRINFIERCPQLLETPNILCLGLNSSSEITYNVEVEFPETFPLYNDFYNIKIHYELIGVMACSGKNGNIGHFVAFCKSRINKQWYRFDDEKVETCSFQDTLKFVTPYILFYHK